MQWACPQVRETEEVICSQIISMGWIPHLACVYTWILSTCQSSAVFITREKEGGSGFSTADEKPPPTCPVTLTFPHSWREMVLVECFLLFRFHSLRVFFPLFFMTTGFSCQWEYKGSFSRVSDLTRLTKETILSHLSQKLTDWMATRAAQWLHLFLSFRGGNPFLTVKLRPTVTNDRSAPVI